MTYPTSRAFERFQAWHSINAKFAAVQLIAQLRQNVARQLQRLGAAHIEGCGTYDDHHMFSLEELQAAIGCGHGRDWCLLCSLAGVWACGTAPTVPEKRELCQTDQPLPMQGRCRGGTAQWADCCLLIACSKVPLGHGRFPAPPLLQAGRGAAAQWAVPPRVSHNDRERLCTADRPVCGGV